MTLGTLRDQVIYPDERDEQLRRGVSDAELETILQRVQLSYILEREGGWDAVQDWMDVLSGGEKQRIAVSHCLCSTNSYQLIAACTRRFGAVGIFYGCDCSA